MLDYFGLLRSNRINCFYYAMAGIMREIGLLISIWDGRTGWDRRGVEGPMLVGIEGVPPLSLEVRRAT